MLSTCLGRTTLLLLLPVAAHLAQGRPRAASEIDAATKSRIESQFAQLPLSFEWNQGQTDPQVKALARGHGYGLFLTATESVLVLSPGEKQSTVLRWKLMGSNPAPNVEPADRLPASVNIFIGNDPSKWRRDVAVFGKMKYHGVYPGIDLVYYGTQRQLEYDFIVSPGADPSRIRFDIAGARKLRIDSRGDLVLSTRGGELRHHRPVVYQEIDGVRREVAGRFVLAGKRQVAFELAAWDRTRSLVIDPSIAFLTYTGGSKNDQAKAVGVDQAGDTFFGGTTASTDFPATLANAPYTTFGGGGTDAFFTVMLFQNGGAASYFISTYFGGSGSETLSSMVLQVTSGFVPEIYVAGTTTSTDLPTVGALQPHSGGGADGFMAHLHFPNIVAYASYLGGSGNEAINGISVDNQGAMVVAGSTTSTNFPVKNAIQPNNGGGADGFVTKVNNVTTGYVFSTYLGGAGTDVAYGVAVANLGLSATNNIYVAGLTTSADFAQPAAARTSVVNGSHAFLTVLKADGSQKLHAVQFGGSGTTAALGVALDASSNAFVTGYTNSTSFPILHALQPSLGGKTDAFLTKFDPTGATVLFSTYFGGTGAEQANAVAVDPGGNAFIAGVTTSTDLPTTNPVQASNRGGADGFVAKILANGSAYGYATYLGGGGIDIISAIAVGSQGNAVVVGLSNSPNLQVSSGVIQPNLKGGFDAFAAKILTN